MLKPIWKESSTLRNPWLPLSTLALAGLLLGSSLLNVGATVTNALGNVSPRQHHATLTDGIAPDQALASVLGSSNSMGSRPSGQLRKYSGLPANTFKRTATTGHCASAPDFNWLHTQGIYIEDDKNCKVRLEGVTWYGMQTIFFVPAGLDYQPYTKILKEIKKLGFNSIRIPITDQLVRFNNKIKVSRHLKKNKELIGLHPLKVLDRIVSAAHKLHLFIILDNHASTARSVANDTGLGDPIWTAKGYPRTTWINDWLTLTRRYLNNPTVVGFDLRNEPHTGGKGPWTLKRYLKQGATWGKYPSKLWRKKTNWPASATKCADEILAINPHLLMFVEGVQLYPDKTQPGGVDQYWWGSILRGVLVDPVKLSVAHQLVYSPHEWGPWKYRSPQFFGKVSYKSLTKLFNRQWGFILHLKDHSLRAPIWLGEFNTCSANESCVKSKHRGSQGQWFQILIKYLRLHPEIGWSYYPINGTNSFNQPSNNAILKRSWKAVKLPGIMKALHSIENQPS